MKTTRDIHVWPRSAFWFGIGVACLGLAGSLMAEARDSGREARRTGRRDMRPLGGGASSPIQVEIRSAPIAGQSGWMTFDVTSPAEVPFSWNALYIYAYSSDGVRGLPETSGGLTSGDLILGIEPAYYTTMTVSDFYNHLALRMNTIGSATSFTVDLTTFYSFPSQYPEEFSFYLQNPFRQGVLPTSDPLGANAFFSLTGPDVSSGPTQLRVYAPAVLALPDTVVIDLSGQTGSPPPVGTPPRYLAITAVAPNPVVNQARLTFTLPRDAGRARLSVHDLQGRLVASLFDGAMAAGVHEMTWKPESDSGTRLASGVYFLRLAVDGRSYVARKVIVTD